MFILNLFLFCTYKKLIGHGHFRLNETVFLLVVLGKMNTKDFEEFCQKMTLTRTRTYIYMYAHAQTHTHKTMIGKLAPVKQL